MEPVDKAKIPSWPIEDHDAFAEWLIEQRTFGTSWRNIAITLNIGRATLYEYFDRFPDVRTKIDKIADMQLDEQLRHTGMELALREKDRQLVMFMLKAKLKMSEAPAPVAEEKPKAEVITEETAKELLKELRAKTG
jgi:crotonobetainyl-CoA:carnitine CoA-transferase CaiB-like acyl-CoA transferase